MRTTLTIEDELVPQIEEIRRREGLSFKATINRLLKAGLNGQAQPIQAKPYRTETRPLGLRAGLDPAKLNQLLDELDADTFADSHKA
jgi:hypothetical protein